MRANIAIMMIGLFICSVTANIHAEESAAPEDVIQINMDGILETGIVAIGGETTGTIIRAGNITFEVELGKDKLLAQRAHKFHKKRVRLQGTLTKKAGVEIPERWIVVASAIDESGKSAPHPNPDHKAFSQISIHLSGGFAGLDEVRLIKQDGNVSNTNQIQRVTESWKIPDDRLAEIHKLVASTDWSKLEQTVRDPNVADGFTYEFKIDTGKKKFEFTRDDNGLAKDTALSAIHRLSQN